MAAPVAGVAAPPTKTGPAVSFVAPTPAQGAVLTTRAATVAFTWDSKPNQTRSVTCSLSGPTSSNAACAAPTATSSGAQSSVSYSGLANGDYAATVTVTAKNGGTTTLTRGFSVEVPQTLYALKADYWQNLSGRYLVVQAFTRNGGATGGAYTGPTLTASWKDANGAVLGTTSVAPFVDAGVYVRHRSRVRIGDVGSGVMPASVIITSSDGQADSVQVRPWLGGAPQAHAAGYQQGFTTHYLDPVEVRAELDALAAQYSDLVKVENLLEESDGYQRKAQTIVGTGTPYDGSTSPTYLADATDRSRAIVLTSKDWGQEGGNQVTVELVSPVALGIPLSVSVNGKAITVTLAISGSGNRTATAAQVVSAINASPAASALVTASTFRGDAGGGVVLPNSPVPLSDFLNAPASVTRGPFQQHLYRIGAVHDGSKVGVLLRCQETADEWVTPLVCVETAERLVRNYATDPQTKALLDELEIFVLPVVNPDGATYSLYDDHAHKKDMTNGCAADGSSDPASRNLWGTAVDHNYSVGSLFDGYVGASTDCRSETYTGPFEQSSPDARNSDRVVSTYTNIKFAATITTGGSITWAPNAYTSTRAALPAPGLGVQGYFRQTAQSIDTAVSIARSTTVGADRSDAGIDVRSSRAGSFTDSAFYNHGIYAFDIGIGAPQQTTQPVFAEAQAEANEFADGMFAFLGVAKAFSDDTTAPTVNATGPSFGALSVRVGFDADDATEVYYTTDGSTPNTASTLWSPAVPGDERAPIRITTSTTLKWIALDVKGNVSGVGTKVITIG